MGRPLGDNGAREGVTPDPSPPAGRCVGRIVVGPSGDGGRGVIGRTGAVRLRTPRGGSAAGAAVAGALDAAVGTGASTGAAGASARGAGVGAASGATGASVVTGAGRPSAAGAARRRPSLSARRRMRSAWASSMDAEGLATPMPSFCASASNSLLDMPSSLESS